MYIYKYTDFIMFMPITMITLLYLHIEIECNGLKAFKTYIPSQKWKAFSLCWTKGDIL